MFWNILSPNDGVTTLLIIDKVDVPNSTTYANRAPYFEWCVVRYGSKNRHQNFMCLEEIAIRGQYVSTILVSIVNTIEGPMWPFKWAQESSLESWIGYYISCQK